MTADLELRRKDPRNADRFYRYPYQGGADLVLQHGEFWWGQVRPERYQELAGAIGKCYGTALDACKADERLVYVEGYCTAGAGFPISHGWCVDTETNEVVDLVLPCSEENVANQYTSARTGMKFLHPSRWAYYGVRFTTELTDAHWHALGLPMLDRSRHEALESPGAQYREDHDFPILKVKYDPNRTEMPPWHKPRKSATSSSVDTGETFQMDDESGWTDTSEDQEDYL
jgi:hypothetical protein